MSSRSSSLDQRHKYENEFLDFLLKIIRNAGGALQLQHITGHMAQLSYNVRCTIGTSKSDLLHFLKRHNNFFSIHDGVVKAVDYRSSKNGGYDSDTSSTEPQSLLPSNIKNGKGVIIKIFPESGLIKAKEPVKTVIYFNSTSYKNKDSDLAGSLYVGAMVYFNAKRKNGDESRSKYYASKVWKVDESDMHSSIVVKKSRKSRDSGLYDPMTLDSEGVIQNVFPNLGFIAVKGDESNTVFFHKNRLLKYDNIVDLTKVLSKGDIVEFTAHRSTKKDAKARWEATKVWKKSSKIKEISDVPKSDGSHSNQSVVSKLDMKSKRCTKEMIKNQRGKICPRTQGAVIKFGQNELADGDASVYYIAGCQVTEIGWEFCDGDDVFFDAVKIKSAPGWKAVLVWIGEKPDIVLPTCVGDFSEFTDDETEDNLSSYMSYSSNSSVKSECSSLKNRRIQKDSSSKLSNLSVHGEDKKSSPKEKLYQSFSQYSSQSSLNSSVKSKGYHVSKKELSEENSSFNKHLNIENKSATSWGDSPYPADDSYNNISSPDNYKCNLDKMLGHNKVVKVPNEEESKLEHLGSSEEKTKDVENINLSLSLDEIKDEKQVISKSEAKASLKKFKCIEGIIIKVYSKFAEVKAKKSENILSFFWNNFYVNGVSVEELELDDLKQVLNVGDSIYFNYFEIVDDSGQNWQKVSLAWKDSKPKKVTEMSPEDFIKKNNLSVSECTTIVYNKENDNTRFRKYLTAVVDLGPDKLDDQASNESYSENELVTSSDHSKASIESYPENELVTSSDHSNVYPKKPSLDYKMMASTIINILKKDLFPTDSKVDFGVITDEIINVVLENHDPRKFNDEFCQTLSQNANDTNVTSNITCADCGKTFVLNSVKDVNTKNSEVQTIITGEIIAQNIFTEC